MDLSKIISISGKPGLYKIVVQSKKNIIVESLNNNKRIPVYSTDRISALQDISIYTYNEDIPLKDVFTSIAKKEKCGPCLSHKESAEKLKDYLQEVLPEYDQERVYPSDIKKLFQWYNTLQKADLITLNKEDKTEVKEAVKDIEEVKEVEEIKVEKKAKAEVKKAPKAKEEVKVKAKKESKTPSEAEKQKR